MKAFFFFIIAVIFFAGCTKTGPDSFQSPGTGKIKLVSGDNQNGTYGELLPDTILLNVSSNNAHNHFFIVSAMLQGNGRIENYYPIYLDSAAVVKIKWRLGCDYPIQKLKFYVYTDSLNSSNVFSNTYFAKPSDSIVITANGVKPNGWCRSCGYSNIDYKVKIIADKDNNLYLIDNGIYKSQDGGYNWYKFNGVPYWNEIADAQFNSKNWLYMVTQSHGVYYTEDLQNWTAINNGIINYNSPTAFFVEDTTLIVSYYFDGPYISTNNGGFWRKMVVGGNSQRFYLFNRHPDGRLMFFDDWHTLKVSTDNGSTWSAINLNYKYEPYSVYDFKIDSSGQLYIGAGDATISILQPNSYQGIVYKYYQWNASSQLINNITIRGTDVFYLVNYTPTPGIYSKNNNWQLLNIGFTNPISYYYYKVNGAFILGSQGYLYYKN